MRVTAGFPTSTAALLSVFASVASAQAREKPDGVWGGFGLAAGAARVSCQVCDFGTEIGPVVSLTFAAPVSRWISVGVEGGLWTHSGDGMSNVSLVIYWYPEPTSAFFFKAGAGLANYRHSQPGSVTARTNGLGFVAGFGYLARVGESVFLGPAIGVRYGRVGTIDAYNDYARTQVVFDFGLAVTTYFAH